MIRRFVGAVAAAVGLLAGLWLMLAPVALGTQPAGMDSAWNDPTMTEFVTGAAVAFVGLVGLIAFAMAIHGEAARLGLIAGKAAPASAVSTPPATDTEPEAEHGGRHAEPGVRETQPVPPAAPAASTPSTPSTPSAAPSTPSEDERVADLLAPLVRALAEDMGTAEGRTPPANGGYTAHPRGGEYR